MRDRFERDIEAYRDGALPDRKLRRIEDAIASDAEAAHHLRQSEALGRLVRESWLEGPPSPPAERILAAIGSELHRIDQERARARRRWVLSRIDWAALLRPAPLAGWGAAAAAALFMAASGALTPAPPALVGNPGALQGARPPLLHGPFVPPAVAQLPTAPIHRISTAAPSFGPSPLGIYDLDQGDGAGLLVYDGQDDSPIMIFSLPEAGDDLSLAPLQLGGWA
jgi:hypothetical protein